MKKILLLCMVVLMMSGCSTGGLASPSPDKHNDNPPAIPPQLTSTADLNSGPQIQSLWISPAVPSTLAQTAISNGIPSAASPEQATLLLDVAQAQTGFQGEGSIWIYALVVPFPS